MKLRSIFSAATLCLSVGIAFAVAEEPADEDSRRELIYSFGEAAASAKEDNTMAKALLQYAGASDPENGWPDTVAYQNDGSTETDDDAFRDYDFSIPYDESMTEKIGIVGLMDDNGELISATSSTTATDNSPLDKASDSILFFEKKAYRNAPDLTKITFESSISEDYEGKKEEESLIVPLAAPISLLILIIGFGVILVTYTSRSKK